MTDQQNSGPAGGRTPLLEWIAAGVGLVLLLGLIGILAHKAWTGDDSAPPALVVTAEKISPAGSGFVVTYKVVNQSGGNAAAVQIEGALMRGPVVVETSMATLDYVPGDGQAEGGVFFTADPRRHRLQLRATGYQTP